MSEGNKKPEVEPSLDEIVKANWSRNGIGDTGNNFHGVQMFAGIPASWSKITPVNMYEAFIREKYETRPDIAEKVIAAGDRYFVETFDTFAERVNIAIATGVTTEQQSATIKSIVAEVNAFIKEYCGSLPS